MIHKSLPSVCRACVILLNTTINSRNMSHLNNCILLDEKMCTPVLTSSSLKSSLQLVTCSILTTGEIKVGFPFELKAGRGERLGVREYA